MRGSPLFVAAALIASIHSPSHADPACELPRLDPIAGSGFTATYYGGRVSGMDLEGEVLAVGAAGEDEASPSDEECNSGAVDVFVWTGSQWSERVRLTAPTPACQDGFGRSVAISVGLIAIGAQASSTGDLAPIDENPGKAYVFERQPNGPGVGDDTWTLLTNPPLETPRALSPDCWGNPDNPAEDRFGFSVDVDGDVLVVGAFNVECRDGEAYVYRRTGSAWSHEATLTPDAANLGGRFGERVAVSGDTIAVSAPAYSEGFLSRGAVYVFRKSTSWEPELPTPILGEGEGGRFGTGLALDGDRLVGGSPHKDCGGFSFGGQARVFHRSGVTWTQQAAFAAPDCAASTEFGAAASIRGDTIAIGASSHTKRGIHSGAAYVFRLEDSTWSFDEQIFPTCSHTGDAFATSLALANVPDLGEALGAVATSDQIAYVETGSAYVFDLEPGGPCAALDNDGDGIAESGDLCCEDARNATSTCDTDSDGYGNVCDPDYDQNKLVDSADFGMFFVPAFKGLDPPPWSEGMDNDCNGFVDSADFGMYFIPKFKTPGENVPGPSGRPCAGTPPCS